MHRSAWCLASVLAVGWPGSSCLAAAEPPSLPQIVQRLKAEEGKLRNITVRAEGWQEVRLPGAGAWKRTPIEAAMTVRCDNAPAGRIRVDYDKQVLEWRDGASPYSFDAYSAAFDGTVQRVVRYKTGPYTHPAPILVGSILPGRTGLCDRYTDYFTGRSFSNFYWDQDYGRSPGSLGDALDAILRSKVPNQLTVARDMFDGAPTIHVEARRGTAFDEQWSLDPAHGYALRGHRWTNGLPDGRVIVIGEEHVTKLIEAAPGIWFPSEAWHLQQAIGSKTQIRIVYRASAVVANDPIFDVNVFVLKFPPGCHVLDQTQHQPATTQAANPKR